MVISYIAVGSNLGDRSYYIQAALKKIRQLPATRVKKVSRPMESPPEGGPAGQGLYLNAVCQIETELFPYRLLSELQRIENDLGRVRVVADGPRTIDLDILAYGDAVMREEGLCIPHPRMFKRVFVLGPLEEIAPGSADKIRKLIRGKRKKPPREKRPGPKRKKKRPTA